MNYKSIFMNYSKGLGKGGLGKSSLVINFLIEKNKQISCVSELLTSKEKKDREINFLKKKPSELLCKDKFEKINEESKIHAFNQLKEYIPANTFVNDYKDIDKISSFYVGEKNINYLFTLLNILEYKHKNITIRNSFFENEIIDSRYCIHFVNCVFTNTVIKCRSICYSSTLTNTKLEKYDISSNYSYWGSNQYYFNTLNSFYKDLKHLKEKLNLNMVLDYREESKLSGSLF